MPQFPKYIQVENSAKRARAKAGASKSLAVELYGSIREALSDQALSHDSESDVEPSRIRDGISVMTDDPNIIAQASSESIDQFIPSAESQYSFSADGSQSQFLPESQSSIQRDLPSIKETSDIKVDNYFTRIGSFWGMNNDDRSSDYDQSAETSRGYSLADTGSATTGADTFLTGDASSQVADDLFSVGAASRKTTKASNTNK